MGDMADIFAGYKEMHKERVKKNPDRLAYAKAQLDELGVDYVVCNESTTQINCRLKSGELLTFYAGTGKIKGYKQRGIRNLIKLIKQKEEL